MKTYQNPLSLPRQDPEQGLGDPFVLRFNGRYYLCPSPGGEKQGVLLWESTDMVTWSFLGNVAPDALLHHTYAPEIFYYNGTFYLVGSPDGEGHYIFVSDSPGGPYRKLTGNLGQTIDGSMFADNDGSLYFYHAEYPSIYGHRMDPDGTLHPGQELYGTSMGHWTEGPGVFLRGNKYYITMTGNHLHSRAYRVDYAYSNEGPLGPFRIPRNKTLLVNSAYEYGSLGHSSTVIGPDLDSYWIFYHSFRMEPKDAGHGIRRHGRFVHMDRMLFNGDELYVSGPGLSETPVPELPDFYGWADEETDSNSRLFLHKDNLVLSAREMSPCGTAEITFSPGENGAAVFAWQDASNYHEAVLSDGELRIFSVKNGSRSCLLSAPLFEGFRQDVLHTLRMEGDEENITFLVDRMRRGCIPAISCTGRIGTKDALRTSYMAFTHHVHQSSDREHYQHIPGFLGCMTALSGSGGEALACPQEETRRILHAGESIRFRINVTREARYHLQATLQSFGETKVEWCVKSGKGQREFSVQPALQRVGLGTAVLKKGCQEWALTVLSGALQLRGFDLFPVEEPSAEEFSGLTLCKNTRQIEGDICIDRMEGLQMDRPGHALCQFGSRFHTEECMEADVIFRGDEIQRSAGIFLRVSENSFYPDQVRIGHRGYYVGFDGNHVFIWRMNFDKKVLARARFPIQPGTSCRIRAEIRGNEITASVNGKYVLSAVDNDSLPYGMAAVGSFGARVTFSRVRFDLK
ncbi:family 43 glycosylhydrolase [Eubacteriales bacterium mix99]